MDCHTKFPTAHADHGRPLSSVRVTCVAPPVAVDRAPSGLLVVPRDGFCDAPIMHSSTARRRARHWNQRGCTRGVFAVRVSIFHARQEGL
jgi:hypothetical protein